jgi:hypothetical protein
MYEMSAALTSSSAESEYSAVPVRVSEMAPISG